MSDKFLVVIFILSGIVCIYAVIQYTKEHNKKYFNLAALAATVASVCYLWVFYGFG